MARRNELAVGQARELRIAGTGSWRSGANDPARVRILGLDQLAELRHRSDYGARWDVHEDLVLVEILDQNGWSFDDMSPQMTNQRPLIQVKDQDQPVDNVARYIGQRREKGKGHFDHRYQSFWDAEALPEGQYLVKPKLLGPVWDQEAKDETRRRQEDHERRNARYKEAVEAQHKLIDKELELAGIPTTRWHGREYHLTFNDMAMLINQLQQTDYLPLVHHQDFFRDQNQDQVP